MPHHDARKFNRFIPREDVSQVSAWDFGAVDEGVRAEIARARAAVEAEHQLGAVAERLQQAHDAGFESGFADGAAQAAAEAEQRLADYIAGEGRAAAERMESLHAAFDHGLDAARQRMARGILDIACALARQVVRRELAVRPDALEPVVHEALAQLRADGKPAVVRLHPQDHATLAGFRAGEDGGAAVAWLPDAAMAPGDCQVESAGTVIDGRIASRWARALAPLGLDAAWDAVPAEQAAAEAELRDAAAADADAAADARPQGRSTAAMPEPADDAAAPSPAGPVVAGDEGSRTGIVAGSWAGSAADEGIDANADAEADAGAASEAAMDPAGREAEPAPADDPFAGIDFDRLFDADIPPDGGAPAPRRAAPADPEADDAA